MNWSVVFLPEADRDLDNLSHTQQVLVKKAISKVQENPLPQKIPDTVHIVKWAYAPNLSHIFYYKRHGKSMKYPVRILCRPCPAQHRIRRK